MHLSPSFKEKAFQIGLTNNIGLHTFMKYSLMPGDTESFFKNKY